MSDVKNKIYNYETPPPEGVWEAIAAQLDSNKAKVIPINKKSNSRFYYLAAASLAIILFCLIFFTNQSTKLQKEGFVTNAEHQNANNNADTAVTTKNEKVIITVPNEIKVTEGNNTKGYEIAKNKSTKHQPGTKIKNENIDGSDNKSIANNDNSHYITIEGLEGKPVKVSTKIASLIDSSDERNPPKPSWNKKINEWREIMKGNTLAPTPGNFLDIIELTKSLKDHK